MSDESSKCQTINTSDIDGRECRRCGHVINRLNTRADRIGLGLSDTIRIPPVESGWLSVLEASAPIESPTLQG